MTFFEQELRKLVENSDILRDPSFIGRACFGDVGNELRARIEFVINGTIDHYSALQVTMMNRTNGVVDRLLLRLEDIIGIKSIPGNPNFPRGVSPHIWVYQGKAEWYAYKPSPEDYHNLRESIKDYVDVFRPREERKPSLSDSIKGAESKATKRSAKETPPKAPDHER